MASWAGYVLLSKPTVLSMADWRTVLLALYQVLEHHQDADQPSGRLHYRLSNDNTAVLLQADFDTGELTVAQLAGFIRTALNNKYTLAQVKTALANNVTLFSSGQGRAISAQAVRDYLAANAVAWEGAA